MPASLGGPVFSSGSYGKHRLLWWRRRRFPFYSPTFPYVKNGLNDRRCMFLLLRKLRRIARVASCDEPKTDRIAAYTVIAITAASAVRGWSDESRSLENRAEHLRSRTRQKARPPPPILRALSTARENDWRNCRSETDQSRLGRVRGGGNCVTLRGENTTESDGNDRGRRRKCRENHSGTTVDEPQLPWS